MSGEWVKCRDGYVRKGASALSWFDQASLLLPEIPLPAAKAMSSFGLCCLIILSLATALPAYFWDPTHLATVATGGDVALTPNDARAFLEAGIKALPKAKRGAAAELAFLFTLVTRLEGALFLALGVSALYALTLPFSQRSMLHLFGAIFGTVTFMIHCSHADFIGFGSNPFVTAGAEQVAAGLVGFWALATLCLWGALTHRLSTARKDE